MPAGPINEVIQYLRSILLLPEEADLTDEQLLECFVSRREPAALEALVRRHSPMVWGLCRRILGNHHDAEDAFQATFLVLVRKAAAIRSPAQLGNWLYGVAHQTALKARAIRAKRQNRERPVTDIPEPAVVQNDLWGDLQPLLDQELSRLPEKYRTVTVLCELEGKTLREAAQQLGCPEGTVASRLARARTMLAKRLAQHGLGISSGALAAVLSQQVAPAGLPTSVVSSTIKATTLVTLGQAATTGVIPAKIAVLTEEVLKSMLLMKLKTATAVVLLTALVCITVGMLTHTLTAAGQPKPDGTGASTPAKTAGGQHPEDQLFQKLKLDADDLAEVTGVNVYKFQVTIPKGQRFRVILRELREKGAEPRVLHQFPFTKESELPTTIRVGFLRSDRKLGGFLLSQEKEAEYRVDCPGCSPTGFATNVPLPLADLPPTSKTLIVLGSDKQAKQFGLNGLQLITVVGSEPGKPAPMPTGFPRAEWLIQPE